MNACFGTMWTIKNDHIPVTLMTHVNPSCSDCIAINRDIAYGRFYDQDTVPLE